VVIASSIFLPPLLKSPCRSIKTLTQSWRYDLRIIFAKTWYLNHLHYTFAYASVYKRYIFLGCLGSREQGWWKRYSHPCCRQTNSMMRVFAISLFLVFGAAFAAPTLKERLLQKVAKKCKLFWTYNLVKFVCLVGYLVGWLVSNNDEKQE